MKMDDVTEEKKLDQGFELFSKSSRGKEQMSSKHRSNTRIEGRWYSLTDPRGNCEGSVIYPHQALSR